MPEQQFVSTSDLTPGTASFRNAARAAKVRKSAKIRKLSSPRAGQNFPLTPPAVGTPQVPNQPSPAAQGGFRFPTGNVVTAPGGSGGVPLQLFPGGVNLAPPQSQQEPFQLPSGPNLVGPQDPKDQARIDAQNDQVGENLARIFGNQYITPISAIFAGTNANLAIQDENIRRSGLAADALRQGALNSGQGSSFQAAQDAALQGFNSNSIGGVNLGLDNEQQRALSAALSGDIFSAQELAAIQGGIGGGGGVSGGTEDALLALQGNAVDPDARAVLDALRDPVFSGNSLSAIDRMLTSEGPFTQNLQDQLGSEIRNRSAIGLQGARRGIEENLAARGLGGSLLDSQLAGLQQQASFGAQQELAGLSREAALSNAQQQQFAASLGLQVGGAEAAQRQAASQGFLSAAGIDAQNRQALAGFGLQGDQLNQQANQFGARLGLDQAALRNNTLFNRGQLGFQSGRDLGQQRLQQAIEQQGSQNTNTSFLASLGQSEEAQRAAFEEALATQLGDPIGAIDFADIAAIPQIPGRKERLFR